MNQNLKDRRNILAILGFAAAGGPALAIEHFDTLGPKTELPPGVPGLMNFGREVQERAAQALEAQAAAVRRGELTAIAIRIISDGKFDAFMRHQVEWTFELSAPTV
jgi:hypothetical protein